MTSSQEPQLTRREMRERERLLEQQRAEAAAAQSTDAAPAAPPSQPYPQQPRMPQPATSGPPQGGGYGAAPARGVPAGAPPRGGQGQPPTDRRQMDPRQGDPRQAPQQRPQQAWGSTPPRPQGAPPQHYENLPPTQRPQPGADGRGATASGAIPPQGHQRGATTSGPMSAPAQRPAQPPVRTAPPQPAPSQLNTPERTLTRRELRAMLDAHTAEGFDNEDDLDEMARPAPARGPAQQRPSGGPAQRPDERREPPPQAHRPPHQHVPTRAAAPHTTVDAGLDEPVVAPKPVGHWTSQLNLPDDREEPYDQLLSRGGSPRGVPTTTNALILPTLPDHGALGTPLAPSGEIMVTGSIDLPRSYGATGVHPSQIDSADVDRMFDSVEDVGTGVAPVAATRAISTQGQNRAMMAPPSKEGMNVPLVLAVTAGVLALGVVATLVVGAVAGLF
jgi:hypothetical protein